MSGRLYHSPEKIVWQAMLDLELITLVANNWPGFSGNMPNAPDACVSIHDTAGRGQGRVMQGEFVEKYGIQVKTRSGSPFDGYIKLSEIVFKLSQIQNRAVIVEDESGTGSSTYLLASLSPTSTILKLGPETPQSRRHLWSYNCVASIRVLLI